LGDRPGSRQGNAKVDIAVNAFARQPIAVRPWCMNFTEFQKSNPNPIALLITPVDSEAGRRKLASELPCKILNAATSHTKVTISRHEFANGKACLNCLYLPAPEELTTEKRLANDLGLPLSEVEIYLADNRVVDADTIRRIENHRGVLIGTLEP